MIARKFNKGVWLYTKDDALYKGEVSLGMLVRCNAQDFNDYEYKQVLDYIADEINSCKTLRRKLDYYSLFNELYYRSSSSSLKYKSDLVATYQRKACNAIENFIRDNDVSFMEVQ